MSHSNNAKGGRPMDGPTDGTLQAAHPAEPPPSGPSAQAPPASPLGDLLAHIARQAPHKYPGKQTGTALSGEPPETGYFQETWEKLSTGLRLEQAQRQVPDNAGPLNSNNLIHRALLLMQDQSPGYLQHFLSYVDGLSWMEQLHISTTTPKPKETLRAASSKKTTRKPR